MSQSATDHATVGFCRQLQSKRSFRDHHKQFLADGVRNVIAALDNDWHVERVIRSKTLLRSAVGRDVVTKLKARDVPLSDVSPEAFRALSQQPRASGIAAIVRQQVGSLASVTPKCHPLWVALSRIRSLGNLGTLLRTSAAVGGCGLMMFGDDVDPFDPAVVRATMGSLFRQTFIRTSWSELKAAGPVGWQIVGADVSAHHSFRQACFPPGTILMLGDERKGLSTRQRLHCDQFVRIPMMPETDSLNVATAGSLLLYEAAMQSGQLSGNQAMRK